MNLVLSYEDIVKKFNFDLVNKLRKHGSEIKYLSLWVPMKVLKEALRAC